MHKLKHTTRKQRQTIDNNRLQTYRDNPKEITASLDFIRSQNQPINDAIKEVGPTKPGSGFTQKISKEEYLGFINSTIVKALEVFGNKLTFEKGHNGLMCINEFGITDNTSNKIIVSNHQQKDVWYLKIKSPNLHTNQTYKHGTSQAIILKIITGYIFDDVYSQRKSGDSHTVNNCILFDKEDFVKYLKTLPDQSLYKEYFSDNKPVNEVSSPFKCEFVTTENLTQSTAQSITTGSTTILTTTLLPVITNTTTAISSQNSTTENLTQSTSTVATIIAGSTAILTTALTNTTTAISSQNSTNDSSITTGMPEQEYNPNLGAIIGMGVVSMISTFFVASAAATAVWCYKYCKQLSGSYNAPDAEKARGLLTNKKEVITIDSTEEKRQSIVITDKQMHGVALELKGKSSKSTSSKSTDAPQLHSSISSVTSISTTKSANDEEKPLLSENEQSSSDSEVHISSTKLEELQSLHSLKSLSSSSDQSTNPSSCIQLENVSSIDSLATLLPL